MPKTSLPDQFLEQVSVENLYNLSINQNPDKTIIVMQLLIPQVNTRDFPLTQQILKLYLPSIFQSTCYNEDNIPFPKEVRRTEVGHLFEHVLLEYLCLVKLENGVDEVSYEGVTDWNWVREPKGTFHITIHAKAEELDMLQEALQRTITLINIILTNDETVHADLPIPSLTTRH
jgi:hypothetical protein